MSTPDPQAQGSGAVETPKETDYHGIVINVSQDDKSVFDSLTVVGRRTFGIPGVSLFKVTVAPEQLESWIGKLQANMRTRSLLFRHGFYFHFYRDDELIIVFKERIFRVRTDKTTWADAIAYGRKLGIPAKQLDFAPCRIEDETY